MAKESNTFNNIKPNREMKQLMRKVRKFEHLHSMSVNQRHFLNQSPKMQLFEDMYNIVERFTPEELGFAEKKR